MIRCCAAVLTGTVLGIVILVSGWLLATQFTDTNAGF